MPYNSGLDIVQWAREATAGTDLAATSKMLVNSFTVTPMDEVYRPPSVRGLLQSRRGFDTVVKRWVNWTAEGPLSYEQAQNWGCGAFANDAAPTGSAPNVWDGMVRTPTAIPTLATFTIERSVSDGSTPIVQVFHYCVITKFTVSFADGETLMFQAEGFGRRVQTEALTGALSLPSPELAPAPLATFYIDTSWAGIGGTAVATQVLGATWEWNTGAVPIWTADGRSDLDFTTIGIDPNQVSLNAKILALVGAQTATEKTAAEAQTLRAIRLQFAGTSSRSIKLDALVKHERGSVFEYGEQDGQKTIEYSFVESTDGTNLANFIVANTVATYI